MWTRLPDVKLKIGDCAAVVVADRRVALYRLQDGYYATQDECLHRGGRLGDGIVSGGKVICPEHQWRFDVRTGACEMSPGTCIRTYPVRVNDNGLEIDLEGGTPLMIAMPED